MVSGVEFSNDSDIEWTLLKFLFIEHNHQILVLNKLHPY